MKRLYYILAISIKGDDAWGKPEIAFVGFQWLLLFCCPILILEKLSYSGKIGWYNYEQIKPFVLWTTILMICLDHFFLFTKEQANKIVNKYSGRYPLIDKYPIAAYFLFHLILPIVLFIITLLISKYLL